MDYDYDECRLSILRSERILSYSDLVSERAPLSFSFFLEVAFLRSLMEILLPKYSPLGCSYCFDFSLNYRLAVLSSNLLLLLDDTSTAFSRLATPLEGMRAESKSSPQEGSSLRVGCFRLGSFFELGRGRWWREGSLGLERARWMGGAWRECRAWGMGRAGRRACIPYSSYNNAFWQQRASQLTQRDR